MKTPTRGRRPKRPTPEEINALNAAVWEAINTKWEPRAYSTHEAAREALKAKWEAIACAMEARGGPEARSTVEKVRAVQAKWIEEGIELAKEAEQLQRDGLPFDAAKAKLGKDLVRLANGRVLADLRVLLHENPPAAVKKAREAGRKFMKKAHDAAQGSKEETQQRAEDFVAKVRERMRRNPALTHGQACRQEAKAQGIGESTSYRHWGRVVPPGECDCRYCKLRRC